MAKFHYRESPSEKQKKAFKKYLSEDEELVLVTSLSQAYIRSKFIMYLLFPGLLFFGFGLGLGWLLGISKIWALIAAFIGMFGSAILKTMHTFHSNRYFFFLTVFLIRFFF